MSVRRTISGPRPPRSGSQSLERGLDILEAIEAENGDIGVRELARRLELSPTIVQRLITSLAMRGYIEKNTETSRYRLGHRSMILGASGERGVDYAVTARRELDRLAHEHQLNGFISVLRGGRAIYLLAVQADGPVAIRVSLGSEMPLHSTAAGKVLLASLDDADARKLLGHRKLAAITPHTITDPAVLLASLAKVRRQGYATEAIAALTEWALTEGEVEEVRAQTLPENEPSIRALLSAGFAEDAISNAKVRRFSRRAG